MAFSSQKSVWLDVTGKESRLEGANQLPMVIEGVKFIDGVAANDTENRAA